LLLLQLRDERLPCGDTDRQDAITIKTRIIQRQSLPNYNCPVQMQSSGQYDNVESTALAKEDRADNSDVPKIQRESIRTRRERLPGAAPAGHWPSPNRA